MSNYEWLFAISDMLNKKLKPINDRLKKIEFIQENEILPCLQNLEVCCARDCQTGAKQIDAVQTDIDVLKSVI